MNKKYIESLLQKINVPWLEQRDYNDHISLIYPFHIIKIYRERIRILYISDIVEEEIIKPSEVQYLNLIDL